MGQRVNASFQNIGVVDQVKINIKDGVRVTVLSETEFVEMSLCALNDVIEDGCKNIGVVLQIVRRVEEYLHVLVPIR